MSPSPLRHRTRDGPVQHHSGSLGLGWILFIALAGGILFFMAVGLLLAWRMKYRKQPYAARVYSYGARGGHSKMKLSKRKLVGNEGEFANSTSVVARDWEANGWWGRDNTESVLNGRGRGGSRDWASVRQSVSTHGLPLLAPLPTYQSLLVRKGTTKAKAREEMDRPEARNWVDEDGLHGPEVKKHRRESWLSLCRDSWLRKPPTLPAVGDVEKAAVVNGGLGTSDSVGGVGGDGDDILRVPKRRSVEPKRVNHVGLPNSVSQGIKGKEPERETDGNESQASSHNRTGSSNAPVALKSILHSTEKRLEDGGGNSPEKRTTPRSSPSKYGSPRKTPKSHKTGSSVASIQAVQGTPTPSPSKRTAGGLSQHGSTTSIGSAANSLIAAATHELELPGGSQSPSRALTGQEWMPADQQYHSHPLQQQQPQPQPHQSPQHRSPQHQSPQHQSPQYQSPQQSLPVQQRTLQNTHQPKLQQPQQRRRRSASSESDVSSSLSTVYSENEPEEIKQSDPFVEAKGTMKKSATTRSGYRFVGPRTPRTLRTRSQTTGQAGNGRRVDFSLPPLAPPPLRPLSRQDYQPTEMPVVAGTLNGAVKGLEVGAFTASSSESSMVTISVHSTEDEDEYEEEQDLPTPKPRPARIYEMSAHAGSPSPSTPTKGRISLEISSSPLDEEEIMDLLLSRSGTRALPQPPFYEINQPSLRGVLSPEAAGSPLAKAPMSRESSSSSCGSSHYDDNASLADTLVNEPAGVGRRDFSFSSNVTALSRQSTVRSVKENSSSNPAVASTVAELRRMNSMISSYSCMSLASHAAGEAQITNGDSNDSSESRGSSSSSNNSSTLGVPETTGTKTKVAPMGSKYYLNIGSEPPKQATGSNRPKPAGSRPSPRKAGHMRTKSVDAGKENRATGSGRGLGLGAVLGTPPRIEISSSKTPSPSPSSAVGLQEGRRNGNLGRDSSFRTGSPRKTLSRLGSVKEEKGEREPEVVVGVGAEVRPESLGLYDADGFLIGSPGSKIPASGGKAGLNGRPLR